MNETAILAYIAREFPEAQVVDSSGDKFLFVDSDHNFPFATLITKDNDFDNASHLDRAGVFRLNLGIGKTSFQDLFGQQRDTGDQERDYAALDQILPHPIYGSMYWISVLNPSAATFDQLHPLVREAHDIMLERRRKKAEPGE